MNRAAKTSLLLAGTALLIFFGGLFLIDSRPPLPTPPDPNGYELLIQAASGLDESTGLAPFGPETLPVLVASNAVALGKVREALRVPSMVTLNYPNTPPEKALDRHIQSLPALKRIGSALVAECQLAQQQEDFSQALNSVLDGLAVARAAGKGGVIIDAMVSLKLETDMTQQAEKILPQLDPAGCKRMAAALEEFDSGRESNETIMETERRWARSVYGVKGELTRLLGSASLKRTEKQVAAKLGAQQHRLRMVMTQAAARAYAATKGNKPARLQDLVPDYLRTLPLDPFSGAELRDWQ
jgi:hypothetical protein